ncbi:hypothetical protein RHGRI_011246 [Rhododendron griersonianum]|uniref:Uncharacterized protein n=1 Tax=Rhododendron griersonianum TaxID=479676 RepID=A0AAV6KL68_9ERIC|nr:hypothetical protein RHGRI_011246 [Rhododendron griersonianum]
MATLNAVIGDLSSDHIPSRQLGPASTIRDPIFTMTDTNSSQSFENRFRAIIPALPEPEPEIDMQPVGWDQLVLEGFPLYCEILKYSQSHESY